MLLGPGTAVPTASKRSKRSKLLKIFGQTPGYSGTAYLLSVCVLDTHTHTHTHTHANANTRVIA